MNVYSAILIGFLVWCLLAVLVAAIHHVAKVASRRHLERSARRVVTVHLGQSPTPHVPNQRHPR